MFKKDNLLTLLLVGNMFIFLNIVDYIFNYLQIIPKYSFMYASMYMILEVVISCVLSGLLTLLETYVYSKIRNR